MRVKEFFSGSGVLSDIFRRRGHQTKTVDNTYDADIKGDILKMPDGCGKGFSVLWFSPPCQCFSVASIGTHWTGGWRKYIPKTEQAKISLRLIRKSIKIIKESNCKYWFIENPRGVLRKVIDKIFAAHGIMDHVRHTVTYCQYGDTRMKPTDIWTNNPHWKPKPMCKNGDPCHVAAPRGAKTGTQGLKGAYERGILPKQLCREIVKACER